jgi:hypothetical protein
VLHEFAKSAVGHRALENFPALLRLRLTEDEYVALQHQGFVSTELRKNSIVFKLRFRLGGKQHVCYLGSTRETAAAVETELAQWQQQVRLRRDGAALRRRAGKMLRDNKQNMQPLLESRDFYFHGLAVRKRRPAKNAET